MGGVVQVTMKIGSGDNDILHLAMRDLDTRWIGTGVEFGVTDHRGPDPPHMRLPPARQGPSSRRVLGRRVEGSGIPYQPWRWQRRRNAENWLRRDPETKSYMPGTPSA